MPICIFSVFSFSSFPLCFVCNPYLSIALNLDSIHPLYYFPFLIPLFSALLYLLLPGIMAGGGRSCDVKEKEA